jgi:hypothetical protein
MKTQAIISTGIFAAILLVLALCRPEPALAVSTVTVSSAGNGVFTVRGSGIESAAALEINVVYDTATLANPRVVEGPLIAGAMAAINPNVPGIVRIVIIRLTPVKGNGVIATMTFDVKGTSPGKITSLSVRLANSQGTTLPAQVQVNNPPDVPMTAADTPQNTEGPAGATATTPPTPPVLMIAGQQEKPGETKAEPDTQGKKEPSDQPVTPEPGRDTREEPTIMARKTDSEPMSGDATSAAQTPESTIFMQKSVLDRFKEYKGGRTPEAFIALFEQDGMFWCRQDPPVALSDGKTVVRVTFITTPGNKTSSDVAVMGARLISLKKDPDNTNTWVAELAPEKGEYRASLAVFQGEVKMVYPLTIAPKVTMDRSRSGTMTKADFYRYFTGRRPASTTGLDANHDGKRDYIDDFIITANYLVSGGLAQNRKSN